MEWTKVGMVVGALLLLGIVGWSSHSDTLPTAHVAAASLATSPSLNSKVTLSNACINPTFDFYIFHLGTDLPAQEWTLALKVQRTRAAFEELKTTWQQAWAAHQYSSVTFLANYYVVVPVGTDVSGISGVTPIYIPTVQLPTTTTPYPPDNEFKAYFRRKNMKTELGAAWPDAWNTVVTRDREAGIGSLETIRKNTTNIPVAVVDVVRVLGNIRGGWTDTEYGTIMLPYATNFGTLGFDTVHFNRTLAHELGHILALAEHNDAPNWLMYNQGPGGMEIDKIEAERTRSILCSPGVRPEAVGKVKLVNMFGNNGVWDDSILNRDNPLNEECTNASTGTFPGVDFMFKPVTSFCMLTEWDGQVLPEPVAVSDIVGSPSYFGTILAQYPGAIIKSCSDTRKCVYAMGGGSSSICTVATNGPATCNKITDTTRGPATPGGTTGLPPNHCNHFRPGDGGSAGMCPADATCPPEKKCAAVGTDCRCIPKNIIHCGDGFVEGTEECDPPGSMCPGNFFCVDTGSGNAGMFAVCSPTCECVPASSVPPTATCSYQAP